MNGADTITTGALALAVAAGGMALGLAYFFALGRTVDALVGARHTARVVGLTVLRIGGAIALLTVLAQFGPVMLLSGFAGFLGARLITTRRARRAG
ncbi:ATP synthase subunit I [Nisaea denitrificans]|uniref:N-ATPase subunit AtpR n=1 Tax=Nisaea denitrificans TaxID=390877 RepID=UPI00041B2956|nr:ATP synthase subunit I [Nisaea denitrificans]